MLNPIEEDKFRKMRDMCRELKMPSPPEVFIGLKVHDKNGVLVLDDIERGHSWTRNFYNMLYAMASYSPSSNSNNFGAGYMSGKTTAGTVEYTTSYTPAGVQTQANIGPIWGIAGDATKGIVLGTGDTAFSVEQFALVTPIANGNAANQLLYGAMDAGIDSYASKIWTHTRARIFNNNSGGTITVKETGLYLAFAMWTNSAGYHMFERTVLGSPVSVVYGGQLTVTYQITMDFSAID
jgi:hypothetical protein